jgi:hypothetical protein
LRIGGGGVDASKPSNGQNENLHDGDSTNRKRGQKKRVSYNIRAFVLTYTTLSGIPPFLDGQMAGFSLSQRENTKPDSAGTVFYWARQSETFCMTTPITDSHVRALGV